MQEIREACDYLLIPFDEKTIHTNNLSKVLIILCSSVSQITIELCTCT